MIQISNKKLIEVSDWDKLVSETYGKQYSFQQQDDCKSRGLVSITISKEEVDDEYPESIPFALNGEEMGVNFQVWLNTTDEQIKEKFKESDRFLTDLFWDRNFYPDIQVIANDLCRKGLIEEGEYSINIDW